MVPVSSVEVEAQRAWNAKHYQLGDGNRHANFHSKWIHFIDEHGNFAEIDTELKQTDDGWSGEAMPFHVFFPKYANGEASFVLNNRYNVFERKVENEEAFTKWLSAPSAAEVEGELYDFNGNGVKDAVLYPNAFPELGADLILYVHFGATPSLQKLVRFHKEATEQYLKKNKKLKAIKIPFNMRFSKPTADVGVLSETPLAEMTEQEKDGFGKAVQKIEEKLAKKTRKDSLEARKLAGKLMQASRKEWAKSGKLRSKFSVEFRPAALKPETRSIITRDFHIWDSGPEHDSDGMPRKQRIDVELEQVGNGLVLTKILPRGFFEAAIANDQFPVFTDATDTFYSHTGDASGTIATSAGYTTWASIRAATDAQSMDNASTSFFVAAGHPSNYVLSRSFMSFDTSSISDDAVLQSGSLALTANSANTGSTTNTWAITAHSSSNHTGFVLGDFDQLTLNSPTELSDSRKNQTGWSSAGVVQTYTLNAAGLSNVSLNGYTPIVLRCGQDIDNVEPGTYQYVEVRSSDYTGTASDPTLSITYYVPPLTPTGAAANAANGSQEITVSWTDNASDETAYYVERSDDGSTGWSVISGALDPDTTSYIDDVGAWSTQKYYRVRAYRSGDDKYSNYSSVVNAKTAPQSPTSLAVSASDDSDELTLTWTDNSSDEDTFSIEASNDGSTGWSEIATDVASPYVHNVGTRDTQKYYRIRAKRNADTIYSSYTNIANGTTAPADPSSITLSVSGSQVNVGWTDNSSTETTFEIERKTGSEGTYIEIAEDTTSPYVDTNIMEGDVYYYRIRARRSDGLRSGYLTEDSIEIPLTAPENFAGSCTDDTAGAAKVTLTWSHTSVSEQGTKIQRSLNGTDWTDVTETAQGVEIYEDTGLEENTLYYYRIAAIGSFSFVLSDYVSAQVTTVANNVGGLRHSFYRKLGFYPY